MLPNNLLTQFLKEEIRLHTSLYKKKSFYSYPLTLFLFFAIITIGAIFAYPQYSMQAVGEVLISIFFIGGVMSGAFGLYARDFLERKFGDFGRLFSNTLMLPIPLKKTFITLAISDTIFYLFWFIIPTILGFGFGNLIMGISISSLPLLLLSVFLMFMFGLFITFFISVLYERNKFVFSLALGMILALSIYSIIKYSLEAFFINQLYLNPSWSDFFISVGIILLLGLLSYLSVGTSFGTSKKKIVKKNSLSFPKKLDHFIFKDFIDLKRTGGLLGKPLFTVLIPSLLVLLLFSTMDFLARLNINLLFFAIIFGTLGTQLLNSLITSDNYRYYRFLPVTLKEYIISKIKISFSICFLLGVLILSIYTYYAQELDKLFGTILIFITILLYNFCLSFYLTGLNPNENLMQPKIFLIYFFLYIPSLFVAMMIDVYLDSPLYYILFLVVFYLLSVLYIKRGIKKWENKEYI